MPSFVDFRLYSASSGWEKQPDRAAAILARFQSTELPVTELSVESKKLGPDFPAAVKLFSRHKNLPSIAVTMQGPDVTHFLWLSRRKGIDFHCWSRVKPEKANGVGAAGTRLILDVAAETGAIYGVGHPDLINRFDPQLNNPFQEPIQVRNLYWFNLASRKVSLAGVPGQRIPVGKTAEAVFTESAPELAPQAGTWWPASVPFEADYEDRERWIDAVEGDLAARLWEDLANEIPALNGKDIMSLRVLDRYFQSLTGDAPEKLARPLGAWIGRLLHSQLGGEWIPRRVIEEGRIRVGSRAWLPFLAASRYLYDPMRDSLERLFAAAARHKDDKVS